MGISRASCYVHVPAPSVGEPPRALSTQRPHFVSPADRAEAHQPTVGPSEQAGAALSAPLVGAARGHGEDGSDGGSSDRVGVHVEKRDERSSSPLVPEAKKRAPCGADQSKVCCRGTPRSDLARALAHVYRDLDDGMHSAWGIST